MLTFSKGAKYHAVLIEIFHTMKGFHSTSHSQSMGALPIGYTCDYNEPKISHQAPLPAEPSSATYGDLKLLILPSSRAYEGPQEQGGPRLIKLMAQSGKARAWRENHRDQGMPKKPIMFQWAIWTSNCCFSASMTLQICCAPRAPPQTPQPQLLNWKTRKFSFGQRRWKSKNLFICGYHQYLDRCP